MILDYLRQWLAISVLLSGWQLAGLTLWQIGYCREAKVSSMPLLTSISHLAMIVVTDDVSTSRPYSVRCDPA